MPDKDASTPRLFLIRHGETEWSQSGRFSGSTELDLTEHGEEQVKAAAKVVYGEGKLIDPRKVAKVLSSPRSRAIKTYELLSGTKDGCEVKDSLGEWDYGDYEGLLRKEINEKRRERGLDKEREWDIWKDGCEGGESPQQMSDRLDSVIKEIKNLQAPHMKDIEPKDVLIFAHGHFIRAFAKRWLGLDLSASVSFMMQPGGVAVLSYEHHNVDEPAVVLGTGFAV